MEPRTTTDGERSLPRHFRRAFALASRAGSGRLDVVLPDGRLFRHERGASGPVARIDVHRADAFARFVRDGDAGFMEGYMDGAWSTPDLQALFDWINKEGEVLIQQVRGAAVLRLWERLRHRLRSNSRAQARRNVARHYDLGNDFYRYWLDAGMTYSSALFRTGQESLEAAQEAKYAAIVDRMGVRAGDHVLEIGCGWGGFAEYAAGQRGLRVTGITLSREQLAYARERIARAGLTHLVDLSLRDYRDERGRYDGVASIEMFEAVGQRYWPLYFDVLRERLRPGARASLQIIVVPDSRWGIYSRSVDFMQRHIFPGGMLPAPMKLAEEVRRAGLDDGGSIRIGPSYSLTLRRWRERFEARWEEIAVLGFDERFRRMWNLYLAGCAGAFEYGMCDVVQMVVRRPTGGAA